MVKIKTTNGSVFARTVMQYKPASDQSFNSLNFRVDYRTVYRGAAINVFFDVFNAYGLDNPSTTEFNERTGEDVIEEGEVFPFLGLRVTL